MADDPRIEPTAKKWRALEPTETGRTVEQFIAELLPADFTGPSNRITTAVLAALREVAGL